MNPIYDFKGRQTLWRSHLLELSGAKFPVGLTADAPPTSCRGHAVAQSRVPRLIGERLAINGDVRPVVGFDQACYRLGYGGGFFDRILATMKNSPLKLGVGYRQQVLLTIHPQPNDVPMDMVNTEEGACLASKSSRPPKALAQ